MGEVAGASFLSFLRLRLDQGRESLIGIEVGRVQAMTFSHPSALFVCMNDLDRSQSLYQNMMNDVRGKMDGWTLGCNGNRYLAMTELVPHLIRCKVR